MIVFGWGYFPQYAARCIGALVRATNEKVVVIATRPSVPAVGMERVCLCPVTWVEQDEDVETHCAEIARQIDETTTVIVSGWREPIFNRLVALTRSRGGVAVCINDANYHFDLKMVLRSAWFRLVKRRQYDKFFVPGKSGRRLMRFYGVKDAAIANGLYSADESLFVNGDVLTERPRRMVYIGQLSDRKNVLRLCEAFNRANVSGAWTLDLYGSGPLKDKLARWIRQNSKGRTIVLHDFLQTEELAKIYREARVFVLASKEEHWGVVVHEAALSGCVLCLSNRVGATEDLFNGKNGVLFDPFDLKEMEAALQRVMNMSDDEYCAAQQESLALARTIGTQTFVEGVRYLAKRN